MSPMHIITKVFIPPAPTPWIILPTISIEMETDRAHMSEEKKNTATVIKRMGLRPNISDTLPHVGPEAANERKKTEPIQA